MEKIGTNIKVGLINEHGINKEISNEFGSIMYLMTALYNCPKIANNVKNILNRYDKYQQKWKIHYEDNNLMIFETKDCWGNLNYFHLIFK